MAIAKRAFFFQSRFDDACLITEFVGIPVTDDHFSLQAHRPIGIS
jgi:hypothetical protein